eukprot:433835-Pelagomonas_calceolata.AAC.3
MKASVIDAIHEKLQKVCQKASSSTASVEELPFDPSQNKHRGQFALRKLYHETDRLIAVLYTSPTCGPCRLHVKDDETGQQIEESRKDSGTVTRALGTQLFPGEVPVVRKHHSSWGPYPSHGSFHGV